MMSFVLLLVFVINCLDGSFAMISLNKIFVASLTDIISIIYVI